MRYEVQEIDPMSLRKVAVRAQFWRSPTDFEVAGCGANESGRAWSERPPGPLLCGLASLAMLIAVPSREAQAQAHQQDSSESAGRMGDADAPAIADIESAAWLAGCWEAASPDGEDSIEEQWMAPRGGMMVGMSRSVRGGETRGFEHLTLRVLDGRLVYHAEPSGQEPTDFPARAAHEGRLEFVNPDHDFPRKIVYARFDDDFFQAAVFADIDGAEPSFLVPYRRVRCPRR